MTKPLRDEQAPESMGHDAPHASGEKARSGSECGAVTSGKRRNAHTALASDAPRPNPDKLARESEWEQDPAFKAWLAQHARLVSAVAHLVRLADNHQAPHATGHCPLCDYARDTVWRDDATGVA